MGIDDIVYFESDEPFLATPLFPIGAYVKELKLNFSWDGDKAHVTIPRGRTFSLWIDGTCIYTREKDAAVLRNIRGTRRYEMRAATLTNMKACAVALLQLDEHRRAGHPH